MLVHLGPPLLLQTTHLSHTGGEGLLGRRGDSRYGTNIKTGGRHSHKVASDCGVVGVKHGGKLGKLGGGSRSNVQSHGALCAKGNETSQSQHDV